MPTQAEGRDPGPSFADGLALKQSGKLSDAERIYRQILARQPDHFESLHLLGVVLHQRGDHADALRHIGAALDRNPHDAWAHNNRGVVLMELERLDEALASFDQAIAIKPSYAMAFNNRGKIFARRGQPDAALASFERALELQPDFAEALNNRAVALAKLERTHEAVAGYDRAIALSPDDADAVRNRLILLDALKRQETPPENASASKQVEDLNQNGVALIEQRAFEPALACFEEAIAIAPHHAIAMNNRGLVLTELKRFDEALASFDRAIDLAPAYAIAHANRGYALNELKRFEDALVSCTASLALNSANAEAYNNKGLALDGLKRFEEAIASYDKAIAINPDLPEVLSNRAIALKELGRFAEAEESCQRAIAVAPHSAVALYNLGTIFKAQHRFKDAIVCYARTVEAKPDFVEAHFNEALCHLTIGDLERAWDKYEWRWQVEEARGTKRDFRQPLWAGEEIAGKTILLHAEQGFGDALQFCRYVPLVAKHGATVVLEVSRRLRRLLSGLDGVHTIVARGEPLPRFDVHCPLLSLPGIFSTGLNTIPPVPHLSIPNGLVAEWEARLGPKTRPRVGICWAGGTGYKEDRNRSMSLQRMLPWFGLPIQLVSLQKDVSGEDLELIAAHAGSIVHFGAEHSDFLETAAFASLMDVVISVDTSVGHLAATLGRPTWTLLTFAPDWRWMLEREDSPGTQPSGCFARPRPALGTAW